MKTKNLELTRAHSRTFKQKIVWKKNIVELCETARTQCLDRTNEWMKWKTIFYFDFAQLNSILDCVVWLRRKETNEIEMKPKSMRFWRRKCDAIWSCVCVCVSVRWIGQRDWRQMISVQMWCDLMMLLKSVFSARNSLDQTSWHKNDRQTRHLHLHIHRKLEFNLVCFFYFSNKLFFIFKLSTNWHDTVTLFEWNRYLKISHFYTRVGYSLLADAQNQ